MYQILLDLSKIAAPFVPFVSEAIYQHLRTAEMPESVHLCAFPSPHPELRNPALEEAMAAVQTTVSLGHGLRKENKLKVRQPLQKAHLASPDAHVMQFLRDQQHLIADELNVKEVVFENDEKQFVSLKAKPNFRVLGKKVGKLMKAAQTAIDAFDQKQLATLMSGGQVTLDLEGEKIVLTPEDVAVDRIVKDGLVAANAGAITIALETELTEALLKEGLAREIVNKINTMRREANFDVSDRIAVKMQAGDKVKQAYQEYADYIKHEVLAVSWDFGNCEGAEWDLNGEMTKIELKKTSA